MYRADRPSPRGRGRRARSRGGAIGPARYQTRPLEAATITTVVAAGRGAVGRPPRDRHLPAVAFDTDGHFGVIGVGIGMVATAAAALEAARKLVRPQSGPVLEERIDPRRR
jgi:hypothetical protein